MAEEADDKFLKQLSKMNWNTDVLYIPYSRPIDYECWIILDPILHGEAVQLFKTPELENDPYIISRNIAGHYSFFTDSTHTKKVGVIVYANKEAANLSLMRLKLKLCGYRISCMKASDLFSSIRNAEKANREPSNFNCVVRFKLVPSEHYYFRVYHIYAPKYPAELSAADNASRSEYLRDRLSNFNAKPLLENFGRVSGIGGADYCYETPVEALAAVWGLNGLHLANYTVTVDHDRTNNTLLEFAEPPFIQVLKKDNVFPCIAINMELDCDNHLNKEDEFYRVVRFARQYFSKDLQQPDSVPRKSCLSRKRKCEFYALGHILRCSRCGFLKPNENYGLVKNFLNRTAKVKNVMFS